MLYCRIQCGGEQIWGEVEDHTVWEVAPDIFESRERTGRSFALQDVRLLAPCQPSKIIAVGLNYKDHIQEFGRTGIPSEPVIFLKAPSAMIGPDDPIRIPRAVTPVDYEAELAVVISKKGHHIPESKALDYVLGCTGLNDVTARALQNKDGQWARAKSFDTFAPVGPWIASGLPLGNLRVEACLNGRRVQQSSTSQMIFSVPRIVSFVSEVMTLWPGDVIATGTPKGIGPLSPGDVVEVFVEGVGRLRNPVRGEN